MADLGQTKDGAVIMARLNAEIKEIENRTLKGMILAAAHVHSKTENTPPLTPKDLGNLKASWFVVTQKGVAVGRGNKKFKGEKAGVLNTEHASALAEAQAAVSGKFKIKTLMMGYSANYALWVHEMVGATFSRAGSGPKWFEIALKKNSKKIVQIIRDNAKIGI